MAFLAPEQTLLVQQFEQHVEGRNLMDPRMANTREHGIQGFEEDVKEFTEAAKAARAIAKSPQMRAAPQEALLSASRAIHLTNALLEDLVSMFDSMLLPVCHQMLVKAKRSAAHFMNFNSRDLAVVRDLIVACKPELQTEGSLLLKGWQVILLLKCFGFSGSSAKLTQIIDSEILRTEIANSSDRQVQVMDFMEFIEAKKPSLESHFKCFREAKAVCKLADQSMKLGDARRLFCAHALSRAGSADEHLERHSYRGTFTLTLLEFALMTGPHIEQLSSMPED